MNNAGMEGASVASLTEFNRSKIVRALYREGVCSRAHIARLVKLTPASVTQITGQLIDMGLVVEDGIAKGRGRRRAIGIKLNDELFRVIGVKFARSRTEIGMFTINGHFVSKRDDYVFWDYDSSVDVHRIIDQVKRWILHKIAQTPSIAAVGIAIPGPFLRDEGRIAVVTGARAWSAVNFKEEFDGVFPVPVYLEHDARAGVLAQSLWSPGNRHIGDLAYLLAGDGVGLGVLSREGFINGANGLATEIGHISIDAIHGKPCECHGRGCLEQYCSIRAMRALIEERCPQLIADIPQFGDRDKCIRVFDAAHAGNPQARDVVETIATYLGYGCVTIINGYNPSRIVIGDFMARGKDLLLDRVRSVARRFAMAGLAERTDIVLTDLGEDPVLCGAGAVAVEAILSHPTEFAERAQGGSAANGHEGVPAGQASLQ